MKFMKFLTTLMLGLSFTVSAVSPADYERLVNEYNYYTNGKGNVDKLTALNNQINIMQNIITKTQADKVFDTHCPAGAAYSNEVKCKLQVEDVKALNDKLKSLEEEKAKLLKPGIIDHYKQKINSKWNTIKRYASYTINACSAAFIVHGIYDLYKYKPDTFDSVSVMTQKAVTFLGIIALTGRALNI